jgi:hypothetical protein
MKTQITHSLSVVTDFPRDISVVISRNWPNPETIIYLNHDEAEMLITALLKAQAGIEI